MGKTELARGVGRESIYGDEHALLRIDMSEYGERHTVAAGGRAWAMSVTTKAVSSPRRCGASPTACCCSTRSRRRTPDIYNILLQVFDDSSLTDGKGRGGGFRQPSSSPRPTWVRTSSSDG
ncbi:hypothetical protein ACVXHA_21515 [Escherichia coli]